MYKLFVTQYYFYVIYIYNLIENGSNWKGKNWKKWKEQ